MLQQPLRAHARPPSAAPRGVSRPAGSCAPGLQPRPLSAGGARTIPLSHWSPHGRGRPPHAHWEPLGGSNTARGLAPPAAVPEALALVWPGHRDFSDQPWAFSRPRGSLLRCCPEPSTQSGGPGPAPGGRCVGGREQRASSFASRVPKVVGDPTQQEGEREWGQCPNLAQAESPSKKRQF